MLETFEFTDGWVAGSDTGNIALNATTFKQGANSLEFDKTSAGGTTASIQRLLKYPMDIAQVKRKVPGATLKVQVRHTSFANFASVELRLIYAIDASQAPTVHDNYRKTGSFTPGAWNEISIALNSPTDSTGSPTDTDRAHLIGIQIVVTMNLASNTFTNLLVDAAEIVGTSGGADPSVLVLGEWRIILPPLDMWNENVGEVVQVNRAETAAEILGIMRKARLKFGLNQVRHIEDVDGRIRTLEESLRRASQHMGDNIGWGVAWPASEIVDTTVAGTAPVEGATSFDVASSTDIEHLGDTVELRIGPNDSRQFERVKVLSRSGDTLTLERALAYAHEVGTPVRSIGHYPTLTKMKSGFHLTETGKAVTFVVDAEETL